MKTYFETATFKPTGATAIIYLLVKRLGGEVILSNEELAEIDGWDLSSIGTIENISATFPSGIIVKNAGTHANTKI